MEQYSPQMLQDMRNFRQLGDGRASSVVQQCRIMGRYWGKPDQLQVMAKELEATRQKLAKYAGAGAVMEAGYMPEDENIEFGYQISLFPEEQWETVVDYALLVGLTATELSALRKMMVAGFCPLCHKADE